MSIIGSLGYQHWYVYSSDGTSASSIARKLQSFITRFSFHHQTSPLEFPVNFQVALRTRIKVPQGTGLSLLLELFYWVTVSMTCVDDKQSKIIAELMLGRNVGSCSLAWERRAAWLEAGWRQAGGRLEAGWRHALATQVFGE